MRRRMEGGKERRGKEGEGGGRKGKEGRIPRQKTSGVAIARVFNQSPHVLLAEDEQQLGHLER